MFKKAKPLIVAFLALTSLILLGYNQVRAEDPPKPPTAQEIIFGQEIKVLFDSSGEVTEVYFLTGYESNGDPIWTQVEAANYGVLCTCIGEECSDILEDNLNNPNVTLDCHEITNAGPRSTGCPIYGSCTYLIGGRTYSLPSCPPKR